MDVPRIPTMIMLMVAEKAVAPVESEGGSGTTSWTTSGWPWAPAAAWKVCCSSPATNLLAALATSSTGSGPGSNAP